MKRVWPSVLALGILVLLVAGPVAAMLLAIGPRDVLSAFATPEVRDAVGISFAASAIATFTAVLLGVPAGYALASFARGAREGTLFLLALPLAFPPVASGVMLLNAFGPQAPLGGAVARFGVAASDTFLGVALAEFFVSGSFVAMTSCASFVAVPARLREAARTLGASEATIFFRVAVPAAAPGIAAGIVLTWLRAIGEYGATSILAYHPSSLPVALSVVLAARGVRDALAVAYGFAALAAAVFCIQWAIRRRVV